MDFGKSFKHYRQKAGLTQKEAADLIGIKDYQLGNYETNRSQPSLEILVKMSKVYLVSVDKMLGNNLLRNKMESLLISKSLTRKFQHSCHQEVNTPTLLHHHLH